MKKLLYDGHWIKTDNGVRFSRSNSILYNGVLDRIKFFFIKQKYKLIVVGGKLFSRINKSLKESDQWRDVIIKGCSKKNTKCSYHNELDLVAYFYAQAVANKCSKQKS